MQVDVDPQETRESLEAIEAVVEHDGAAGFCPTEVSPCGPGVGPLVGTAGWPFWAIALEAGTRGPQPGRG